MQRNGKQHVLAFLVSKPLTLIFGFDLCRFIFCRGVFALHSKFRDKPEFLPRCCPALPDEVLPNTSVVESLVFYLASSVGVADQFEFPASLKRSAVSDVVSNRTSVDSLAEDFNNHGLGSNNWGGSWGITEAASIRRKCWCWWTSEYTSQGAGFRIISKISWSPGSVDSL